MAKKRGCGQRDRHYAAIKDKELNGSNRITSSSSSTTRRRRVQEIHLYGASLGVCMWLCPLPVSVSVHMLSVCASTSVHARVRVCIHYVCLCVFVCPCVSLCACACVCARAHVCVCVHGRAYQRTLEKGGGGGGVPGCTCDDIGDQGVIHALPQGEGRGRGQRVLQVPRPRGRDPRRRSLLARVHLVHGVQRAWRQQLSCRDTPIKSQPCYVFSFQIH